MKNKIIIISLIVSMIFAFPTFSFAIDDIGDPPEQPQVESYQDNYKINEYNDKAIEYNKKVDEYNTQIDNQYNTEKESIDKQNAEGQAKQEASQKAHENAVRTNEEAQKRADEQNAKIDEQNATGRAKAEESVVNHNNAIAENEEVKKHNTEVDKKYEEDLAQYNIDKAKYDSDYEAYSSSANQTDIKNKKILENAGFTIEEYNMNPLKSPDEESWQYVLNNPVYRNTVRQENTNLKDKEYTSTVSIQKSDNPSGIIFTLHIEHVMIGGQTYIEDIEFDANDIVTVNSLAFSQNCKSLYDNGGYCAFYSYQGNNYLSKYWYQSFAQAMYPPVKSEYKNIDDQWSINSGDQYIFTYQHGKKYTSDSNEITVSYYYNSQLTCNVPLDEPTPPEEVKKGKYRAEVDVPNIVAWEDIPYVTPELVNVPDVYLWESIKDPIKGKYLNHISLMNLFDIPNEQYKQSEIKTIEDVRTNSSNIIRNNYNNNNIVYYGSDKKSSIVKYSSVIKRDIIPLSVSESYWALLNLILALATCLIVFILIISGIINKRKENEDTDINNKWKFRISSIFVGIISLIVFFITENVNNLWVWIDKWTWIMLVIFIVNLIIMGLSKHKEENNNI